MANLTLSLSTFLTFFVLFSTSPSLAAKCNSGDLKALMSIKQSLGNPKILSSWNPSTDCCTWSRIQCNRAGRVMSISIRDTNVPMTIPSSISDLTALISVSFIDLPGLTGPIPASLFKLTTLKVIAIIRTSVSSIAGPISDSIAKLSQLDTLDLSSNELTGPIPSSLNKLPKLRFLDMSHNHLTGSIPPGLVKGRLSILILSHNLLTGQIPKEYGSGDLEIINASHNQLTGDLSFLFSANKVTDIDLAWNRFAFDMSNVVFSKKLTDLDLSHNSITGRVPSSIRDLAEVRKMDLSYNQLCGEIPSGGITTNLGAVSFAHNKCLCGAPLSPCHKP
ncbi:hypothetical protein LUZ60_003379 [Juncus effusus]|nr:hypothetical protein LUZ60_003379 [Juncus effusus]